MHNIDNSLLQCLPDLILMKKKTQLSSFDIMVLSKELKSRLNNGFIDKVYQHSKTEIIIRVTVPSKGRDINVDNTDQDKNGPNYIHFNLVINTGKFLFMEERDNNSNISTATGSAEDKMDKSNQPGSFAMLLRKHLKNGKITNCYQYQFERIIIIDIQKREQYQLVIEIFGDGNILLIQDGRIIQPLFSRTWSARTLRAGEDYKFPPKRIDPRAVNEYDFIAIMKNSNKDLVRTLIMGLDIPGKFSEELCFRTALDKNSKPDQLRNEQYTILFENMKKMLNEIEFTPKPFLVFESETLSEPFEFLPIKLGIFNEYHFKEYEDYNSMVLDYFRKIGELNRGDLDIHAVQEKADALTKAESERERLTRQLEQQEDALKKFQREIEENHIIGETIYTSYQRCDELLSEIQRLRSEFSPNEIIEHITDTNDIIELNPHEGYVKIKLNSIETGDVVEVKLDFRKNVMENANIYYERSKHSKEKLQGVEKAIITTENALNELKDKVYHIKSTELPKIRPKISKHFWFEKYHWFISTKGNIIAAGRDAKSNEQLVKKYLRDNDRYCHADLSGAPSVVVKHDPVCDFDGISEETMVEACKFAVIFSKAWNAKIGAGSAYWVKPDQVSKTPQSGEFLARGAFVIRGKRNYISNIKLELGVGEIIYQGKHKFMAGPVDAIKGQCERYVILVPGDVKKNSMAKELSELFNVAIENVLSTLPAGEFKLIDKVGFRL